MKKILVTGSNGQLGRALHQLLQNSDADVTYTTSRDQFRLYQLIWKRFAASCMADAKYHTTSVKIDGAGYRFTLLQIGRAFV